MADIRTLLHQLAQAEVQLQSTQFLAPWVNGGKLRTRIAGMVYTFEPQPPSQEGWGIFQPVNPTTATWIEAADLPQIEAYLQHFPILRSRLAYRLQGQTWLAYPVNEADMQQRFKTKTVKPIPVHLVTQGTPFEPIVARWNGDGCWFEAVDRRADPQPTDQLQSALNQLTPVDRLQFQDMTPEMRSLYAVVAEQTEGLAQPQRSRPLEWTPAVQESSNG
jgi:hypothetical protein